MITPINTLRKFKKKINLKRIDTLVFCAKKNFFLLDDDSEHESIECIVNQKDKKIIYEIFNKKELIHRSVLFERVHLLKLLNKEGPVIGDCFTSKKYRGQSIYPRVLKIISKDCFNCFSKNEVFIIVDRDNFSSIRGIEKAGFKIFASIKCFRWLVFYFKKNISYSN